MPFLLLITAMIGGPNAHAADFSQFRPSENVEDRRDGLTQSDLDPAVQELLVKAGKLAAEKKFPFTCPALKPAAEAVARLGSDLEKTPTLWKLKTDFDAESGEKVASALLPASYVLDVCREGAKAEMLRKLKDSAQAVYEQAGKLRDTHRDRYWDAINLGSDLEKYAAAPHETIVDSINAWMGDLRGQCRTNAEGYSRALEAYVKQVNVLAEDYGTSIKALAADFQMVSEFDCEKAPAETVLTKKAAPKKKR